MFTTERKPLWNSLKSSYLLLDRKSHTKSKIARKGYKTWRLAYRRGGSNTNREGVGRGGGAAPGLPLKQDFLVLRTPHRCHQGRIYSPPFLKTRHLTPRGSPTEPSGAKGTRNSLYSSGRSTGLWPPITTHRYPGGGIPRPPPQGLSRQWPGADGCPRR